MVSLSVYRSAECKHKDKGANKHQQTNFIICISWSIPHQIV